MTSNYSCFAILLPSGEAFAKLAGSQLREIHARAVSLATAVPTSAGDRLERLEQDVACLELFGSTRGWRRAQSKLDLLKRLNSRKCETDETELLPSDDEDQATHPTLAQISADFAALENDRRRFEFFRPPAEVWLRHHALASISERLQLVEGVNSRVAEIQCNAAAASAALVSSATGNAEVVRKNQAVVGKRLTEVAQALSGSEFLD